MGLTPPTWAISDFHPKIPSFTIFLVHGFAHGEKRRRDLHIPSPQFPAGGSRNIFKEPEELRESKTDPGSSPGLWS